MPTPLAVTRSIAQLSLAAAAVPVRAASGLAGGARRAAENLARVEHLLGDALEEGRDLIEDGLGVNRRVWDDEDLEHEPDEPHHRQIEVRGLAEPDQQPLRSSLQSVLARLDGLAWTEVNALTGRVAVGLAQPELTTAVVTAIEQIERAHGLSRRRMGDSAERASWDVADRADHPADLEPIHRATAAIAGDLAAIGWSLLGRAVRAARVPVEITGMVSMLDNNPWLRRQVQGLIGRRAADLVLPISSSLASGISQGPVGVAVDLAHHLVVLGELRARRQVWQQREPEFYAQPSQGPIEPPEIPPRPAPLPKGPVERWSDRIALGSLGGFAATLAATRDLRRSADAFLAGMPKAARLGREGFAAQLGRALAARGVVPLDASALRRLDRVDTVVLDSDCLATSELTIERVVPFGALAPEDVRDRAELLLDPADLQAERAAGGWSLAPLRAVPAARPLPRGAKARAAELRRAGVWPLLLFEGERLEAVVGVAAALEPGVEAVVDAVRAAGHTLVVAGELHGAARRVGADRVIPRGKAMGQAVRRLQGEGAVVLCVARRGKRGLAAADVAVGITRPTGRPPWAADLVLGRSLAEAAWVIEATAVAAEVSRRSARFAMAGSALGALVALTGPRNLAGSRSLVVVNGAAGAALVSGMWSAVQLALAPRALAGQRTPWHALDGAEVLHRLESRPEGLTDEAARARQRARGVKEADGGLLEPFLAELVSPLNPVLGIGAALAAATGSMVDAGLVLSLVAVNTLIGGLQRLAADRTVAELLAGAAGRARVLRDGQEREVPEDTVVPGDIVVLRAGDPVPADCRILAASGLEVDESTLTGESLPVAKSHEAVASAPLADRTSMLYEDTAIAAGRAVAVVVATGAETELARSLVRAGPAPETGVEVRLRQLARRILPASAAVAAGVAAGGFLRRWPLAEVSGTGVSLAVASVPEGLPFVASAAQIAASRRLARRGAVVRNPRSIEALGRIQVLCFDKTGTLTEGRMRLRRVSDGATAVRPEEAPGAAWVDRALAAALRASSEPATGAANHTDEAIFHAAAQRGVGPAEGLSSWERVADLPFEAHRGVHAVLGRCADGHRLSVKGAPEAVLAQCTAWWRGGELEELDRAAFAEVEDHVAQLATRGYRLLAVAERTASQRTELDEDRIERLELVGLLAFADPVRATAAEAVAGVIEAGIRPVMITGDHPSTAAAIASELGILDGASRVLTGAELAAMDEAELDQAIGEVCVFARVVPRDKVRIVQAFQRQGAAVSMTGDGANDAAAIRLADVGVALGARATAAARDAADLVVTDDRIETLVDAVIEGRALWGSVREALAVLLGGNLGEIGFTALASALSNRAPMSGRQFLLVNMLTDLMPALAIAMRPPDRSRRALLREGPDASLGPALRRDIALRAVATGGGASAAWLAARMTGSRARASTVAMVALVTAQLGQTILAGGARQPATLATGLGSAALMAAIVQTPGASHFFGCRPLGPLDWAQGVGAGMVAALGAGAAQRWLDSG